MIKVIDALFDALRAFTFWAYLYLGWWIISNHPAYDRNMARVRQVVGYARSAVCGAPEAR